MFEKISVIALALQWDTAKAEPQRCNSKCPGNVTPVCGRDNRGNIRTFSNDCNFGITACKEDKNGKFIITMKGQSVIFFFIFQDGK